MSMDLWILYYTLVITQCFVIYFVAQIDPALAIGSSFSWLLYPFDKTPPFFFPAFPYFVALQDAPGSSSLFHASSLESVISPRNLSSIKVSLYP